MHSSPQQISTQFKLFESHLQGINNTFTLLQSQSTQQWRNLFDSLSTFKDSVEKSLEKLESKEQYLNDREKSLNLREEQLNSSKKHSKFTEGFVCDRCKTLGVKVSEIGNVFVKIEDLDEVIDVDDDENDDNCDLDASIKLVVTMDGKSLQIFLNDKVDMHEFIGEEVRSAINLSSDPSKLVLDAMEGFFRPHLKKGGVEYEGSVVRSSCVVLLEQLMELKVRVRKGVREEARVVANRWWEKVRFDRGDCRVVLGFLLLVVVYDVWSEFDKNELRSLGEVVKKHRVFGELNSRIWFLRKCGVSNKPPTVQKGEHYTCTSPVNSMPSPNQKEGHYTPLAKSSMAAPVEKESPNTQPVNFSKTPPVQKEEPYTPSMNTSVSPSSESTFDVDTSGTNISAIDLKLYLIKNVKDLKLIDERVLEYLLYASDPAKLVFDVVQDFYLELDLMQGDTILSCCVFLLEQLMAVSPHITTVLEEKIMNFAARWKARLAMTSVKPNLVFGFLKFLVAYKLSGSFVADEILSLVSVLYESDDVYTSEQISMLCHALGLEEKIPEFVQSLVKENKHLEAVRYVCAFQLTDTFSPSALLKQYLDYTKETAFETCKNFDDPIKAENKSASRQIRALQSVLNCIFEFKLDFECSPIDLQQQIRQLEQEKEQRKSLKSEMDMTGKKNNSTHNGLDSSSDCITPKKRAVIPTVTPSEPLEGQSQEKRPHIDVALSSGLPNLGAPMDLSPPSSRSSTIRSP